MQKYLVIAGLGNPGDKYTYTRHNLGFLLIDEFRQYLDMPNFKGKKNWHSLYTEQKFSLGDFRLEKEKKETLPAGDKAKSTEKISLLLIKPQTYMNLSGLSLHKVLSTYKVEPEQVLVIHDEVELEYEKIKLKKGGGHRGHNGIRNISEFLGSKDYYRLQIGVGRHNDDADKKEKKGKKTTLGLATYLLQQFTEKEHERFFSFIEPEARKILLDWCYSRALE